MRDPYKVMVFGPGRLGSIAIWETTRLPAFELVGVRAYSEHKDGRDVGELLGIDSVGVTATTDADALRDVECDCVIYCARDLGTGNTDDEIVALLEEGRDVVTALPYQNAQLHREADFLARLDEACRKGGATFHATGLDPDLITERVVLGLTGMCTDLRHLTIRETYAAETIDPILLAVVGFGRDPEQMESDEMAAGIATNALRAIGRTAERSLGVTYARVEEQHDYVPAGHSIAVDGNEVVKPGTVGRVSHRLCGWIDGGDAEDDEPYFTMEYHWYLSEEMLPPGVGPRDYWVAEIEGVPSARMAIDLRTSLKDDRRRYEIGSIKTDPGYHGTMAPCLQAIPLVCEADPGILPSFQAPVHYRQDVRETRLPDRRDVAVA